MKKIKGILTIFLSALMILSCLPVITLAAASEYDAWINGERFTSANAEDGIECGSGRAYYDPEKKLMTLNNITAIGYTDTVIGSVTYRAAICAEGDLELSLIGNNVVSGSICADKNYYSTGVFAGGTLTVSGLGKLTASGNLSMYRSAGIAAGNIILRGDAQVEASGGRFAESVNTYGYGLLLTGRGELTVKENAKLTAVSYKEGSTAAPAVSRAIYSPGTFSVLDNASVSALALPSADNEGSAIIAAGDMTFNGANVTATAQGAQGIGIELKGTAGNTILFNKGTVTAKGGKTAVESSMGSIETGAAIELTGLPGINPTGTTTLSEAFILGENARFAVYAKNSDGAFVPATTAVITKVYESYDLWLGDRRVTSENSDDIFGDGTAAFYPDKSLLLLNNCVLTGKTYKNAALYAGIPVIIGLEDGSDNRITGVNGEYSYGIYAVDSVVLTGKGSLTVQGGNAEKDSYGMYLRTGSLVIAEGKLTANSGKAGTNSMGLCLLDKTSGNLSVSGDAIVRLGDGEADNMRALYTNGSLAVSEDASLIADSSDSYGSTNYGIRVNGTLSVSDTAYVSGTAGTAADFSIGVYVLDAGRGIELSGGTLNGIGGNAKSSEGVYSKSALSVTGGMLNAESADTTNIADSISYAAVAMEAKLFGGETVLGAGNALKASCALYSTGITIARKAVVTASCGTSPASHALGAVPAFVSYLPRVRAGENAPGEEIAAPDDKTYVNSRYVYIEGKFKSQSTWYALAIKDQANTYTNNWLSFTAGTIDSASPFCYQYGNTVAAEYYNGYVYGIENTIPYKLWRSAFDGENFNSYEEIGVGVKYKFSDICFDYVSGKMYAIGDYNGSRALFSVDLLRGTAVKLTNVFGTKGSALTLAINNDGRAYTVDTNGIFYSLDLETGYAVRIADTGIVSDGVQSMSFDRETGELFWAQYSETKNTSAIYIVNAKTGKADRIEQACGRQMQLSSLFMVPDNYGIWVSGSPVNTANAKDLYHNGMISFDPNTDTLTLNNTRITAAYVSNPKESHGIYTTLPDLTIVLNGENAIILDNVTTQYSAAICSADGHITIKGPGKLTTAWSDAATDYSIVAPGGLTVTDCELLCYSDGFGIIVSGEEADIDIVRSQVSVNAAYTGVTSNFGNVTISESTFLCVGDKAGETFNCSLFAAEDILVDSSSCAVLSTMHTAVGAGGMLSVKDSTFEMSGDNRALVGGLDTTAFEKAAVFINSKKASEEKYAWDWESDISACRYILVCPCPHQYTNDCDPDCDICGETRYASHMFVDIWMHNSAYHWHECSVCGAKKDLEAHIWDEGVEAGEGFILHKCLCGLEKLESPVYALGDADDDGSITTADARAALRIAVGLDDYPATHKTFIACDVDMDGSVTTADARSILRAAVGLEDFEPRG